jgi:hypothetical protein
LLPEELNFEGREQDRKKLVHGVPIDKEQEENLNKVIFNQWIVQL